MHAGWQVDTLKYSHPSDHRDHRLYIGIPRFKICFLFLFCARPLELLYSSTDQQTPHVFTDKRETGLVLYPILGPKFHAVPWTDSLLKKEKIPRLEDSQPYIVSDQAERHKHQ